MRVGKACTIEKDLTGARCGGTAGGQNIVSEATDGDIEVHTDARIAISSERDTERAGECARCRRAIGDGGGRRAGERVLRRAAGGKGRGQSAGDSVDCLIGTQFDLVIGQISACRGSIAPTRPR